MKGEKVAIIITYLFGLAMGAVSYFLGNYLLSLTCSIILYFGLYLAFRKIFSFKEFTQNTLIGYFGLWFIVWVILLNLLG